MYKDVSKDDLLFLQKGLETSIVENRKNRKNPSENEPRDLTLYSTHSKKDVAKVQKDLQSVVEKYQKKKSSKEFLTDLSFALGIEKQNASEYVKFTAKDGTEFTIRASNHNANAETFLSNNELKDNISIVVKSKQSKNKFFPNDNVELIEYVYFKEDIIKSNTNVLSQIAEALIRTVENGLYTDTTGLAKINKSPNINQDTEKIIETYTTPQGEVYGFATPNGELYFDETVISPNHPLHEYTHLWDRALAKNNPEIWKRAMLKADGCDEIYGND